MICLKNGLLCLFVVIIAVLFFYLVYGLTCSPIARYNCSICHASISSITISDHSFLILGADVT